MECNNKHCLWNYNEACVHESEEGYLNAIPNALDCPSSLREDFEQQLYNLKAECESLLNYRTMKELMEIKKFIENQRK